MSPILFSEAGSNLLLPDDEWEALAIQLDLCAATILLEQEAGRFEDAFGCWRRRPLWPASCGIASETDSEGWNFWWAFPERLAALWS